MALTTARRAEMLHSTSCCSEASECALVFEGQCKGDCLVSMSSISVRANLSSCQNIDHQMLPKNAGIRGLLELAGSATSIQRVASVEGLPCCTGLLDGPAALIASILTCGPSSDAGSAALQAGQDLYTMWIDHILSAVTTTSAWMHITQCNDHVLFAAATALAWLHMTQRLR